MLVVSSWLRAHVAWRTTPERLLVPAIAGALVGIYSVPIIFAWLGW